MEPMLALNSSAPGNIAVASKDGVRITTDAGATFGTHVFFKPPPGFEAPEGNTDIKFDGQGRLSQQIGRPW
jgi:hypothetical protein